MLAAREPIRGGRRRHLRVSEWLVGHLTLHDAGGVCRRHQRAERIGEEHGRAARADAHQKVVDPEAR